MSIAIIRNLAKGGGNIPVVDFPWDAMVDGNFNKIQSATLPAHGSDYFYTQAKCPKIGSNLYLTFKAGNGSGWYTADIELQYSTDGTNWTTFYSRNVDRDGEYTISLNPLYGKSVYFKYLITDCGGYQCIILLKKFLIAAGS